MNMLSMLLSMFNSDWSELRRWLIIQSNRLFVVDDISDKPILKIVDVDMVMLSLRCYL